MVAEKERGTIREGERQARGGRRWGVRSFEQKVARIEYGLKYVIDDSKSVKDVWDIS